VYTNRHMSNEHLHIQTAAQSTASSSARDLREQLKQTQANDTRLRLFLQFGQLLLSQGCQENTALSLLQSLCHLTSAQHALIAVEGMGKLTIYAQMGRTLPVGTRLPMIGVLAQMLKNPVQFELHLNKNTQLWTHGDASQQECLIPLALNRHSKGIIGLSGKELLLGQQETEVLQTVSGLFALAIAQMQGPAPSEVDMSVIESLTPREREIFALLPGGLSNIELGRTLGISPGTAKIHVERILNKLGVKDRTQAAVKAVELGYKASH
jgi:DNA-binding CsgD family transcriptional regulator